MRIEQAAAAQAGGVPQNKGIRAGDVIKAEVIKSENGVMALKLPDGTILTARRDSGLPLPEGQTFRFNVEAFVNGELRVSIAEGQGYDLKTDSGVSRFLKAAGLPETPENAALVRNMESGGLRVTKESANALAAAIKRFPELTPKNAVFMARENIPINAENVGRFNMFLEHKGLISEKISDILNLLDKFQSAPQGTRPQPETRQPAQTAPQPQQPEVQTRPQPAQIQQPQQAQPVPQPQPQTVQPQQPQPAQPQQPQAVQPQQPQQPVQQQPQQPVLQPQPVQTQQPQAVQPQPPQQTQPPVQQPVQQTQQPQQQQPQSVQVQPQTAFESPRLVIRSVSQPAEPAERPPVRFETVREAVENLFKAIDPARAKTLPREINAINITRELNEALELVNRHADNLDRAHAANRANAGAAGGSDAPSPGTVLRQAAAELDSSVRFINQVNNYTPVVAVPIKLGGERGTAELYVFNDSSNKSGRIDPQNATVFLSLATANSGRVETYIKVLGKNVECDFGVERAEHTAAFAEHLPKLNDLLDAQGFRLSRTSVRRAEKNSDIFDVSEVRAESLGRYFFDRRA